jgi:hypothetical protein
MRVAWLLELAHVDELRTQRQNAHAGLVDAPLLFVFGSLSSGIMPVHVEDRRHLGSQRGRLIENCRALHAGDNLVAEFPHAVSVTTGKVAQVFILHRPLGPFPWPAMKNNLIQDPAPETARLLTPLRRTRGNRQRSDAAKSELLNLVTRYLFLLNSRFQRRHQQLWSGL